jgi:hypothetical protein
LLLPPRSASSWRVIILPVPGSDCSPATHPSLCDSSEWPGIGEEAFRGG